MSTEYEQTIVPARGDGAASSLTTKELLSRILSEGNALIRKEVELARAELTADVRSEARMAKTLGVGAILGLCGLSLALVTVVLALSLVMPGWAAGLIVTAAVVAVAGMVAALGWSRRVRAPLERTRKHLKEDVQWMKERLV
jgi:hypothetical protein